MDTLYIIGNGFDLHHGLDTSYKNFRDNVVLKTPNLRRLLLDLYGDDINEDMWWSDFEAKLSDIDYNHLLNSDNGVAMGGMKVQNFLTGQLPPLFGKWIKSIKLKNAPEKQLDIDKDALFFTFNYSLVLEKIYKVNKDNIWHIHNSIEEVDKIIVGHDSDLNTLISNYNLNRGNKQYNSWIVDNIIPFAAEGAKDVEKRIADNMENFNKYSNIKHIISMGFSFNKIDMPYVKAIISSNTNKKNIDWTIYYHQEGEDKTFIKKLNSFKICDEQINDPIRW